MRDADCSGLHAKGVYGAGLKRGRPVLLDDPSAPSEPPHISAQWSMRRLWILPEDSVEICLADKEGINEKARRLPAQ